MSAAGNKAVFLSYASQDAEAARKICDALRAAGIEVWFDQSELRGGDAWDQKIRRQIKECALFAPVISANTQARREGYFRREWKLAVDRTHDMDEGLPFLVPVVIDGTRDADAFVPEKFRDVQWTRLAGGAATPAFCSRVAHLLAGEPPANRAYPDVPREDRVPKPKGRSVLSQRVGITFAVVFLVAVGSYFALRSRTIAPGIGGPAQRTVASPLPAPATIPTPAAASPAAVLTDRALALTRKLGFSREDLASAEDLSRQATELEPTSARTWGVRAWVQAAYINRNWDRTPKRREDAQQFANHALSFNPDEPEALNALAEVLGVQGAHAASEALARRAVAAAPDNFRSRSLLASAVRNQQRMGEALALMRDTIARDPSNPLARYDLATALMAIEPPDMPGALEQLDAIPPPGIATAQILKARVLVALRGDVAAMRSALDALERFPIADRTEDRAVYVCGYAGLLERKPEHVFAATALTARTYFEDAVVASPKAWLNALAHQLAGHEQLARNEWQAAEAVLRDRLRTRPGSRLETVQLAVTLAWLGRTEEVRQLLPPLEAVVREQPNAVTARWIACCYAAMGDAGHAAEFLALAIDRSLSLTRPIVRLDPWWDRVRGKPEFDTLVAAPAAPISAAPAADQNSIAVLAFANHSVDPDAEYLSDGITEELINTLGRVPGLTVKGPTSAFFFKGRNVPAAEIAEKLGVAYLLRGSVRKQGTKVRIMAQLSRAASDEIVWSSEPMERDLKDVFAVQDEITALIAKQLSLQFGAPSRAPQTNVSPEAVALYLRGRELWNRRTEDDYVRAEALFDHAVELAPGFARAYVGRADARGFLAAIRGQIGTWAQADSSVLREIGADVQRALELDPNSAEAHASMGNLFAYQAKPEPALAEYATAIRLNPNYASAHQWLALEYWRQGRLAEAREAALAAVQADPLSSVIAAACSVVLQAAGEPDKALVHAEHALALQPTSFRAMGAKASILWDLGRHEEAVALARSIVGHDATTQGLGRALFVLGAAGKTDEVERARVVKGPLAAFIALQGRAALGKWDEFFASWKPANLNIDDAWYLTEHALDPIRSDPRFLGLLNEAGLLDAHNRVQAWRAAHPSEKSRPTR